MYTSEYITSERIIKPYRSGIQLVKAKQGCRLSEVYDSSISTYFMSTTSRNVAVNEATAALSGACSARSLIGLDAHDLWNRDSAFKQQADDKQIIQNQTLLITDDSAIRSADESHLQMITFKMPWYDEDKVIGIYGMTLQMNRHSLGEFAKNLTTIIATGLIKTPQLSNIQSLMQPDEENVYFSKRETDIIKLLVNNLTAKQIAQQLSLSKRTVENYIANIKIKADCDSKYALIEKYYWKMNKKMSS